MTEKKAEKSESGLPAPRAILGRKLGMRRYFREQGEAMAVTVIEAASCTVIQKKTRDRDGYEAVQLGFGQRKAARLSKAKQGHLKKAGVGGFAVLKEFRVSNVDELKPGQALPATMFRKGDRIDVTGRMKGRGFAGGVRRYRFAGGPASHGSMFHRAPGAIGACAYPAKTWKGRRLPGHMGDKRRTVLNLEVVDVRPEQHLLIVKGSVPGSNNSVVEIRESQRG